MRGKPFQSGNRFGKGRPRGSRNQRSKLLQSLEEHGESILQKCKLMALSGDRTALRLCLERLLPPAKVSGPQFRLPKMQTATDWKDLLPGILQQTSRGRLHAHEAEALARVVDTHQRTVGWSEIEERLRALEKRQSDQESKNIVWMKEEKS